MNTVKQLERDTAIMTMNHETMNQMNRYEATIKDMAAKVDCGLITYREALSYVRSNAR